jgi:hypothetical protein
MADLTIYVDVQLANGQLQTMSGYKIPPSGKTIFENIAKDQGNLEILPKHPNISLPFCKSDGKTEKTLGAIAPGGKGGVKICDSFTGQQFLYTARIGDTNAEDPIVIIERKMNFSPDPYSMLFVGLGVGAALAYLVVKARAGRQRPQQG